jgi:hypothetical protein
MVGVTQVEPGFGQVAIEEAGPVSPCSSAIASRMGAIILHGPYHFGPVVRENGLRGLQDLGLEGLAGHRLGRSTTAA